jgi:hypothetical protein
MNEFLVKIVDKNLEEVLDQEVEIVNHPHPAVVYSNYFVFFPRNFYLDILGNDHPGGNGSMDEDEDDDDASVSDRSSRGSSSVKQTTGIRWDYRVI